MSSIWIHALLTSLQVATKLGGGIPHLQTFPIKKLFVGHLLYNLNIFYLFMSLNYFNNVPLYPSGRMGYSGAPNFSSILLLSVDLVSLLIWAHDELDHL